MAPTSLRPNSGHTLLPFFDAEHQTLATALADWSGAQSIDESDDRACLP
jgi:hypothetical protein